MQKEKESGIELAAKDLSDVVELIKHNKDKISDSFIDKLHIGVKETFIRIYKQVNREIRKKGKKYTL